VTTFERLHVPDRWRGNYEEVSRLEHRGCAGPALRALEDSQFELVPIKRALEALLSLETVYPSEQWVVDKPRIESAVREILLAVGENPDREGLKGTPRRVAEAYEFLFSGLAEDPAAHLSVGFH
jgi:GTP cyclohydrolase I